MINKQIFDSLLFIINATYMQKYNMDFVRSIKLVFYFWERLVKFVRQHFF